MPALELNPALRVDAETLSNGIPLLARRRGDETMAEKYRQSAARAAARREAAP